MVQDKLAYNLGGYVSVEINNKFRKLYPNSNIKVIKTLKAYNAYRVPIHDLPLLKVYRVKDVYRPRQTCYDSILKIEYHIPFPVIEIMPNLLVFVAEALSESLLSYDRNYKKTFPPIQQPIEIEYQYQNTLYSEVVHGLSAQVIVTKLPYEWLT